MVNWIEIGLFLYALAGSAATGYWLLITYSPVFRERDKNTKLGYSVIAGMIYTGAIFFVSIVLVSGHYNNLNFLETFFWMIPISFVLLALTATGKRAWILIERAQYGEQAPQKESEEMGTSILTSQTPGAQRAPSIQTESNAVPFISETSQPIERETGTGTKKWGEEKPLEEPESAETEEPLQEAEPMEETQEPLEAPGEAEKDVVEEIRKIMKGEMTEKEKKESEMKRTIAGDLEEKEEIRKIMGAPFESEEELPSALSSTSESPSTELEKIKADLKKKIQAKESAEKIKEGLKKK
jgi:hypothetical protein